MPDLTIRLRHIHTATLQYVITSFRFISAGIESSFGNVKYTVIHVKYTERRIRYIWCLRDKIYSNINIFIDFNRIRYIIKTASKLDLNEIVNKY